MIGQLRFTRHGRELVATLDDEVQWFCPGDRFIDGYLNLCCGTELTESPAQGWPGLPQLLKAQKFLGGEIEDFSPEHDEPEAALY